ncbi:penicillin-binding protein [Texcoconibacillus texcoconensis]|uniref:serine-type D-Ala-D-Ala carboxypeptidase n=1 Tax=Texcoconibacillus texcoconensis TaxID=1095777 RepID=A0A840QLD5_9BACI|nr:penicillin-binding protein [Texcoconibacillus texcoconensis]MBB5172179.1 penicillin-binding protein 2B [Texcoconibacillus texcoconensis]
MKTRRRMKVRAVGLFILFFLFFLGIFGRFIYIQAAKEVSGNELEQLIERHWSQSSILEGERGMILDRDGEVLAEEIPSYTVVAILDDRFTSYVEDAEETANALSTVLEIESEVINRYLTNGIDKDLFQVELGPQAKHLSYETMQEIEDLDLDGIRFVEEPRRYYSMQTFASHVLGYTERDMGEARMGLESMYNDYLEEEDGKMTFQQDDLSRPLPNTKELVEEPKDGHHLQLTIDSNIQMVLEQAMSNVDERYTPERIMAVVADAQTGEVLGMSNRPSFNPNEYQHIENYTNYTISSRFEPGSTMKMYTLAAAIEEGIFDADETFQSGSAQFGATRISDHNQGRGWGEITYREGVQRSSNVAFAKLVDDHLGADKLYDYLEFFGFRDKTGIQLPNEVGGLIAEQYPIDAITTSFGQGTAVTPIQQIQAATAFANDGEMIQPYIIDTIIDPNEEKTVYQGEREGVAEPISAETAHEVRELLGTVVSSSNGTGQPYAIEGLDIAGKTGTAQIPHPDQPGYKTGAGNHIYSFMGMAPQDDPQVLVYVAVDRPDLEPYEVGSQPVSEVFRPVMKQTLQYLNITGEPSVEEQIEDVGFEVDDYRGDSLNGILDELEESGVNVIPIGGGDEIIEHLPGENDILLPGETMFIQTDRGPYKVPDMNGWSKRQVHMFASLTGVEVTVNGNGFVFEQNLHSGTEINQGGKLSVNLSPRTQLIDEPENAEDELDENEQADFEEGEFFMN